MYYSDPNENIYALFSQVMRHHYQRSHALLEKINVYPGQPPLLFVLGHHDGLSQRELSDRLNVKPATMTVMLKRMEKAGYIKREQDTVDQRIIRVFLTDSGRVQLSNVKKVIKTINHDCFKNLTEEEEVFLKNIFIKMRDNLCSNHSCNPKVHITGDEHIVKTD